MPSSRRRFLKYSVTALLALPLAQFLAACTKGGGGEALPEGQKKLDTTDPVAQALGYTEDATKVDVAKFPKKAGPDGASQKCSTCVQYTAVNGSWGRCNIFPQGLVAAEGW